MECSQKMSDLARAERRFMAWLQDHGAQIDALEISNDVSGSRGAVATRDIPANEVCISIPEKLLLSEPLAKADPTLGPIFAAHADLFTRDDTLLSTYLTYHFYLQDASFFHPYLAILPSPESILNWPAQDLAQLQDAKILDTVARRNHEIIDSYTRITTRLAPLHPDIFNDTAFSLDSFRFSWQTIQARTFGSRLPWTSFVPFADCLNHANHATTYEYAADDDGCFWFRWHSSQPYAAGHQVFNSYGRRGNQPLLLDYGFALPKNEWDYVDVDLDVTAFKLPKFERRRLFLSAHLLPFASRVRLSPDTDLNEVLPYYRCACLGEASSTTSILEPQAPQVELEALGRLRDQLALHLSQWPTTLDDDARLLTDTKNVRGNFRTAVVYRHHRKHIVHRVLRLATAAAAQVVPAE
ncbi:Aste57867_15144 [Aphanomyces stellatus]|uniref:Aste57867_15144 protein n=1 Tax=Aphanomyces stellatus TaxID=120398 RepID=A0A485L317_9STRA|nr:hypothetical protein As57867_015088 [Aphanomyces stellatus]VFT91953.1 Aste57867_15144 [Aphanomyces stellatus]